MQRIGKEKKSIPGSIQESYEQSFSSCYNGKRYHNFIMYLSIILTLLTTGKTLYYRVLKEILFRFSPVYPSVLQSFSIVVIIEHIM